MLRSWAFIKEGSESYTESLRKKLKIEKPMRDKVMCSFFLGRTIKEGHREGIPVVDLKKGVGYRKAVLREWCSPRERRR